MPAHPPVELQQVTRRFGATEVLRGITLAVEEGSFTTILGPSGCGKSTTLRIMAGLDQASAGSVRMAGRDVSDLNATERNVAMVFQSYALYPHLTVAENIALPLAMRTMTRLERAPGAGWLLLEARRKRSAQRRAVWRVAEMLGIEDLLHRKPSALSGGQKQRVAVGRALVRDPAIFLFDEPLSNLDAKLRVQMRGELLALHTRTGKPFVYVTHDQAEAMSMSTHVVVMMDGRIAQQGRPQVLYTQPETAEVAAFIGTHPINLLEVPVGAGALGGPFGAYRPVGQGHPDRALLGLRPEDVVPDPAGGLTGRLARVEYLGAEALITVTLDDGRNMRALAPGEFEAPPPGDPVRLAFDFARAHLFDTETGHRLGTRLEAVAA